MLPVFGTKVGGGGGHFRVHVRGFAMSRTTHLVGSIPTFSTRVWEGTATKSFALKEGELGGGNIFTRI